MTVRATPPGWHRISQRKWADPVGRTHRNEIKRSNLPLLWRSQMIRRAAWMVVRLTEEINRRAPKCMDYGFQVCRRVWWPQIWLGATVDRTQNLRRSREPHAHSINSVEINAGTQEGTPTPVVLNKQTTNSAAALTLRLLMRQTTGSGRTPLKRWVDVIVPRGIGR